MSELSSRRRETAKHRNLPYPSSSCGRKRLHKAQWLALAGLCQCVIAHHRLAADDRGHRPARGRHAVEWRPAAARGDPAVLDLPLFLEVHDGEVRIETACDAAL